MEPVSELRTNEVRRSSCVKGSQSEQRASGCPLLIRVVPPKHFGPFWGLEAFFFTIKVPDSSHVMQHACMHRHMDIGRANLYEQVGRQAGLRMQVVIAGA